MDCRILRNKLSDALAPLGYDVGTYSVTIGEGESAGQYYVIGEGPLEGCQYAVVQLEQKGLKVFADPTEADKGRVVINVEDIPDAVLALNMTTRKDKDRPKISAIVEQGERISWTYPVTAIPALKIER